MDLTNDKIDNIVRKYGTKVLLPLPSFYGEDKYDDINVKAVALQDEVYISLEDNCLGCGASGDALYDALLEQNENNRIITLETQIAQIETDPLRVQQYLEKIEGYSLRDVVEGKMLHVLDSGISGKKENLEMTLAGQETGSKSCHIPGARTIKGLKHVLQPSVVIYHGGVGKDYEYEVRF